MSANSNPVRKRIVDIAAEVFGLPVETVENGISPDSVKGWDSEKHVELIVALEDCFGCMFDVDEIPELISLEQIEGIVTRHGAASDK